MLQLGTVLNADTTVSVADLSLLPAGSAYLNAPPM
jgi:hypothetical protein